MSVEQPRDRQRCAAEAIEVLGLAGELVAAALTAGWFVGLVDGSELGRGDRRAGDAHPRVAR